MTAYYNENDPNTAEWLRQLIQTGAIAPSVVDERSIVDVPPADLKPYDQLHFFAGIGTWSYALRQSGWPDDRSVVTGSCPCQPYSQAGKRKGSDDERDLWWAMFWHIEQLRPQTIFGEQVASKDGLIWWDVVQSDLERAGYAATTFDLCAAGVGAPHIRQRLFWVANTHGSRQQWTRSPQPEERNGDSVVIGAGKISALADANSERRQQVAGRSSKNEAENGSQGRKQCQQDCDNESCGDVENGDGIQLGNANRERLAIAARLSGASTETGISKPRETIERTGGKSFGFWDPSAWMPCQDGKFRATKPGTFPMVDGIAADLVRDGNSRIQTEATAEARKIRIKGYGNAIVAPLAIAFIEAAMEVIDEV